MTPSQCADANKNHNQRGSNIFGYDPQPPTVAAKPVVAAPPPVASVIPQAHDNGHMKNKKRTGYNPITGQCYDEEKQPEQPSTTPEVTVTPTSVVPPEPTPVEVVAAAEKPQGSHNIHTSSRVLQPPGGRSTKLW